MVKLRSIFIIIVAMDVVNIEVICKLMSIYNKNPKETQGVTIAHLGTMDTSVKCYIHSLAIINKRPKGVPEHYVPPF